MSPTTGERFRLTAADAPWLALIGGLLVLYVPTVVSLARSLWLTDQNSQGPIVLAVAAWFFWFKIRRALADPEIVVRPAPVPGWCLVVLGLVTYVIGRSQEFYLLEVGSAIPLLLGALLTLLGKAVVKRIWFAFFFLVFLIPMPGAVVDTLTQPMKIAVSWGSEGLLRLFDLPVARKGVIIFIGSYQLLVADACAGLNSLFTLEALGLLYMNATRHESAMRNFVLAALIVPISFTANVVRVVALALITYYAGDGAGQGFLHEFSGMVLFLTALMLIIGLDGLLRSFHAFRSARRARAATLGA
jgi:exosortase B